VIRVRFYRIGGKCAGSRKIFKKNWRTKSRSATKSGFPVNMRVQRGGQSSANPESGN